MKTFYIIFCAALLIGTAIAVKPAHPGHPGHPEHPAHPAHPANPAEPQNPRFSLFAPIVFYPVVIGRAIIVTVATIIRSVIQCVLAYIRGSNPSLATTIENFNNTAISCMMKINQTESFDPQQPSPPPPLSPNPTLDEMCDNDDSGRVFDSTSKDIAFDGAEQTHYYISGEVNTFGGYRADDPQYLFNSPQFRPAPPPVAPATLPYATSGGGAATTCATVTQTSVYVQATYFIALGNALKQTVIDIHNDIQEIKNSTGIECDCTDNITPTIKQITDDIDAINTAMVYNQYYYYSYAAMITVSSSALITKMDNSIKKCQELVTKVKDSHVKINSEIKLKNDKSYKKLKEDKKGGKISDDKYCEGVRKQNTNSRKHGRKYVHNGFRKNRRERENKEKNVKKARKTMVENWIKTVAYYDYATYYINDWQQIVKPKLNGLSDRFKTITKDMERIFSNRDKKRNHLHTESNNSYVMHSDKHHREHERCTEIIIKNNSNFEMCQNVLDKIQDYTLSFDIEARKCNEKAFKTIDDVPDNSEAATMKIGEMLQNITKGVDKCLADTNSPTIPYVNWLPIWTRNICADCLDKILVQATSFASKAEALCQEELDNSTLTTAVDSSKECHKNKADKLPKFTIAFELEMNNCKVSTPTVSTPSVSTTKSSTTGSSTKVSSTTQSSTTKSSTTGSSTKVSSTIQSSTKGSTTPSSTTKSSTTKSSTTGSTTPSSTTKSSTTGSTTPSSTTKSSTTGSTTPSSTTKSSTTGSTTPSSTTKSSTTGSTTPSSTTKSSTTGSSTTGSTSSGSTPSGSTPSGSTPSGSTPSGSTPSGSTPSGTTPSGTTPSGSTPSGSTPSGSTPSGSTPSGSSPSGSTPSGSTPSGSTPSGSTPSGSTPSGSTPSGSTPSGSTASGSTPSGSTPSGSTSSGSTPSGSSPSGSTPSGSSPSGSTPSASTPSGSTPSGSTPSATTHSGSTSSGTTSSGTTPSDSTPSGSTPSDSTPSGSTPSGSTSSGSTPSGSSPSGSTPSGSTPSGSTPSGSTPSGSTPSGTTPSGSTPSGTTPSGTTPSGSTPSRSTPSGSTHDCAGSTTMLMPA